MIVVTVGLHREHQAGAHGSAVEHHGAGAAHAVLAADMGAGQQQLVAQKIAQQHARFDRAAIARAVDRHGDARGSASVSCSSPRPLVRRRHSARAVSTPARWR